MQSNNLNQTNENLEQESSESNTRNDNHQIEEDSNFEFSWRDLLKYFGPGLLISIAYLDPGNLAGDMEAGLLGGYRLLWVLLLSTTLGYFFQVKAMQIGLTTGKDLAKLCRIHMNSFQSRLLWVMAEIAIMGSDIQEVLGTAIGLKILFGIDLWIGVLLTILTTFLILLIKVCGMDKLEAIFALLIGTMAVSFFINLSYISPKPTDVLIGTVVPYIPNKEALLASVGLIGAVLMPHNLYLHSALVCEKKIDRSDKKLLRKSFFYFKIETGLSLILSFIISAAVISTFAYYSDKMMEIKLSNAGDVLATSFGTSAKYIWGIGLLASGQSSTLTGTLAGQYVMSGFIQMKIGDFSRALLTRGIAIIPSIVIAFVDHREDFNSYLNLLQAIQLPFAIIPLLKFANSRQIMGENIISRTELYALSVLSALIVIANYSSLLPEKVDFSSLLTYVYFILFVGYFSLLILIMRVSIDTKYNGTASKDSDELEFAPDSKESETRQRDFEAVIDIEEVSSPKIHGSTNVSSTPKQDQLHSDDVHHRQKK